uniref:KAT8 regulatory NSL complex subunit 2 n=1 Tax=Triatoma dimidiata TaxID=72491 RepID=A0A0V0G890_TRIDM
MIRQQKSQQINTTTPTKKINSSKQPIDTCAYQPRICTQPVLEQYEYCMKHILEDKNAPFKPCGYAYPINNKRCLLPAQRGDKKDIGYCPLHMWKTQMKRQRSMSKYVPPPTPEALLSGLSHYVRPVRSSTAKLESDELNNTSRTKPINPFVEADIAKVALNRTHVLECASESDSDVETATLDNIWKGANEDSSDAESIDSQVEEALKHADYYTAEEVVHLARNKLIKLQLLYQKQFERLTHILKEKRRRYLIALKKERETLSSISDQARTSAKEQKLYEKLKALNRYHKRSNAETVAYLACLEKRNKEMGRSDSKSQVHPSNKCNFTEGGVRCSRVILPLTKYCFKHILEDPNQTLFKACGCEKADTKCHEPISGLCTGETCILHVQLPSLPHLNFPESSMKVEAEVANKNMDESELDASATESAFSTDNRDSPDDLVNTNEDSNRKNNNGLFGMKLTYSEDASEGVSQLAKDGMDSLEENTSNINERETMDVISNGDTMKVQTNV